MNRFVARDPLAQSPDASALALPEATERSLPELRARLAVLEAQVAELQRSLAASQVNEERYRTAFRFSPNAITITRLSDGRYLDVNDGFTRAYGWSRDEVIGRTTTEVGIWKNRADREALVEVLRRDGYCENFEAELKSRDGKELAVTVSAHQLMVGSESCLLAITHDVTERKHMLDALREQKEFFHLLAENLSDFIAVLDREGRRLYNSPSYRQFFGAADEMRGSDSFAQVHPDDRQRVRNVFDQTVSTGLGQQLEYRLVVPDGSVRIMESRGSVIRDRDGRVSRVIVVSRDITERKQMEDQVRQMAFHDALTNLPNRRLFHDRLTLAVAAAARSRLYGAVMFLDLDNFKPLNDSHGHDVGDLLLIEVAARLKSCVREMDTVARFGGDEFVVMISELASDKAASTAEAALIAEKIRLCLAAPYRLLVRQAGMPEKTVEHRCTASIGVVVFVGHETSQDNILKCADAAMYLAKESGRNSVRFIALEPTPAAG